MQVFMLQKHGFRAIACANETYCYWVEFYPNSPHFSADEINIGFLETWLQGWELRENAFDMPDPEAFSPWKQEVEKEVDRLPKNWELMSRAFFLARLSVNEALGAFASQNKPS